MICILKSYINYLTKFYIQNLLIKLKETKLRKRISEMQHCFFLHAVSFTISGVQTCDFDMCTIRDENSVRYPRT